MTDVSELIERVARAVRDVLGLPHGHIPSQIKSEEIARAAIEASGVQSLSERNAVLEDAMRLARQTLWTLEEVAEDIGAASITTGLKERIAQIDAALTKEGIENG